MSIVSKRVHPAQVWNPAFDVTPAALITGVVTERGLVPKGSSGFDVRGFMREQGLLPQEVQVSSLVILLVD